MTPETKERLSLKDVQYMARLRKKQELMTVRAILEDLVRQAYPRLANKCLCARCLTRELQRGAGNAKC